MSYNKLSFSRYTHSYIRGDIVAIFHSLKMKPLFISESVFITVKDIILSSKIYTHESLLSLENGSDLLRVIELLCENRVLNNTEDRDDIVITHFRNSLSKPNIRIAYFILAESCNLSCVYCFEKAPDNALSSKLMSFDTALNSLDFFEKMTVLHDQIPHEFEIIFYGGEPLLNYPVLISILKEIDNRRKSSIAVWNKTRLSMVTNGTLLTDSIIDELVKYNVSIAISVDGPESITNKNRILSNNQPAFNKIMHGINLCKSKGIDFSLSITLSEIAVKNYDAIINFIKEVKPSSIGFNMLLTDKDFPVYEGYNDDAANFLIRAFTEFRETGLFEDRMMRKVNSFVKSEVYPFDCGASGGNQVVFSPSGMVGICHGYLREKKFFPTNVKDDKFNPETDEIYLDWGKRSPLNMDDCQSCEALGICGGGCPMNAERNNGSIWTLDERFCSHSKKTLEWLIWDLLTHSDGVK